MPRLPDLAGYSFDELQTLVSKANKRLDEIRSKRIKELEAELTSWEPTAALRFRGEPGGLHKEARSPQEVLGELPTLAIGSRAVSRPQWRGVLGSGCNPTVGARSRRRRSSWVGAISGSSDNAPVAICLP